MSITAYVGPLGSGKTMMAVADALRWARRLDRPLFSNIPIRKEWRDGTVIESQPITSFAQLHDLDQCEVLLDEVVSGLNSRDTMQLSPSAIMAMDKMRQRDVGFYWTAPAWGRADTVLRAITTDIYVYRPIWKRPVKGQRWPRTYVTSRRRYLGEEREGSRLPRKPVRLLPSVHVLPWSLALGAYSTINPDQDRLRGAGKYCSVCGGVQARPVEKCTCDV